VSSITLFDAIPTDTVSFAPRISSIDSPPRWHRSRRCGGVDPRREVGSASTTSSARLSDCGAAACIAV
jgi:hypothetical protein